MIVKRTDRHYPGTLNVHLYYYYLRVSKGLTDTTPGTLNMHLYYYYWTDRHTLALSTLSCTTITGDCQMTDRHYPGTLNKHLYYYYW
ncbi:hypothetical protein J6590_070841 [Homalodisca vitripennis]|nr:hypothetical protein J6590_070841 [Homalodisca vitripennis]